MNQNGFSSVFHCHYFSFVWGSTSLFFSWPNSFVDRRMKQTCLDRHSRVLSYLIKKTGSSNTFRKWKLLQLLVYRAISCNNCNI